MDRSGAGRTRKPAQRLEDAPVLACDRAAMYRRRLKAKANSRPPRGEKEKAVSRLRKKKTRLKQQVTFGSRTTRT